MASLQYLFPQKKIESHGYLVKRCCVFFCLYVNVCACVSLQRFVWSSTAPLCFRRYWWWCFERYVNSRSDCGRFYFGTGDGQEQGKPKFGALVACKKQFWSRYMIEMRPESEQLNFIANLIIWNGDCSCCTSRGNETGHDVSQAKWCHQACIFFHSTMRSMFNAGAYHTGAFYKDMRIVTDVFAGHSIWVKFECISMRRIIKFLMYCFATHLFHIIGTILYVR